MYNRAIRRHHNRRTFNRTKYVLEKVMHDFDHCLDWTEQEKYERIAKKANNFTTCSCWMCMNERHNPWLKAKERLTMQERKFNEKFKYELKEITEK